MPIAPRILPAVVALSILSGWCFAASYENGSAGKQEPGALFRQFEEKTSRGERAILPDFSYAGYRRCEKPLPKVSRENYKYFDVTDYGAVPNDRKSDRDAALAAFAAAHAHKGKAVIYFPRGNFRLFEPTDFGKPPLEITRSNVVLKGSGVGTTRLEFAESHLPARPLIKMRSNSGKNDYFRGDQRLRAKFVRQIDRFTFEVDNASELKPGMRINLNPQLDPTTPGAAELYGPHEILSGIHRRAKSRGGMLTDTFELHEVKQVRENRVTLAEPIHLNLEAYSTHPIWRIDNVIEEAGIEDLSFRGGWRGQFKHHNGSRYGEDFRMIEMERAFHCWVRRVRFTECSSALTTWMCAFNTVRDLLIEGNTGHLSVVCYASYGNLFAFMREQSETHHGFGVARSASGTVFYRCHQHDNLEAHGGYPRATLFDRNVGGFVPRGGGAAFSPYHDRGLVFWNWKATRPGSYDFWAEGKRYGYFLYPVVAGLHGEPFRILDAETDLAAFESVGEETSPRSLFEAQLARRLGKTPDWLIKDAVRFEKISRYSQIKIVRPRIHGETKHPVEARFATPPELDPRAVKRIQLQASKTGLHDGFRTVARVDPKTMKCEFSPRAKGAWALRAKLTNIRGEISFSDPVTIFIKGERLQPLKVARSAMMLAHAKAKLYQSFMKLGGGEGRRLKVSNVLPPKALLHRTELEAAYRDELHQFYAEYGKSTFSKNLNVNESAKLFDGNTETAITSFNTGNDGLVQVEFDKVATVSRLDIVWPPRTKRKEVRLEIQTSTDPQAWNSFVNDDRRWVSSAGRIGGTLKGGSLRISRSMSTLYFPPRKAKYVRLLLTSFPSVAEFRFYGEP